MMGVVGAKRRIYECSFMDMCHVPFTTEQFQSLSSKLSTSRKLKIEGMSFVTPKHKAYTDVVVRFSWYSRVHSSAKTYCTSIAHPNKITLTKKLTYLHLGVT